MSEVDTWMGALGGQPASKPNPGPKYIAGPLLLAAVLTTATANDTVDLTTTTATAADARIGLAYGTASEPEAVLHIDRVGIQFGPDFMVLTPAQKWDIVKDARLEVTVAGQTMYIPLHDAALEVFTGHESHQAVAADEDFARIMGALKMPEGGPLELRFDEDTFKLVIPNSVAHGGLAARVIIDGFMFPADAPRDATVTGGVTKGAVSPFGCSCKGSDGPAAVKRASNFNALISRRVPSVGGLRGGGGVFGR